MRPYFKSWKFWLLFTGIFILTNLFLVLEYWGLWKDDFKEGLPPQIQLEWLSLQFLVVVPISMLAAFLASISVYAARQEEKRQLHRFFSGTNISVTILLASAIFYYSAYLLPGFRIKGAILMADIINMKPGGPFVRTRDVSNKPFRSLNYSELDEYKDSVKLNYLRQKSGIIETIKWNIREKDVKRVIEDLKEAGISLNVAEITGANSNFNTINSWECCHKKSSIDLLITRERQYHTDVMRAQNERAKMIHISIAFLLFYFLGVMTGYYFCPRFSFIPGLISFFVLFPSWYYLNGLFRRLFLSEKTSLFIGVNGSLVIMSIAGLTEYILFRITGVYKRRSAMEIFAEEQPAH